MNIPIIGFVAGIIGAALTGLSGFVIYAVIKMLIDKLKITEKILDKVAGYGNFVGILLFKKLKKVTDTELRAQLTDIADRMGDAFDYGLDKGLTGVKVTKYDLLNK